MPYLAVKPASLPRPGSETDLPELGLGFQKLLTKLSPMRSVSADPRASEPPSPLTGPSRFSHAPAFAPGLARAPALLKQSWDEDKVRSPEPPQDKVLLDAGSGKLNHLPDDKLVMQWPSAPAAYSTGGFTASKPPAPRFSPKPEDQRRLNDPVRGLGGLVTSWIGTPRQARFGDVQSLTGFRQALARLAGETDDTACADGFLQLHGRIKDHLPAACQEAARQDAKGFLTAVAHRSDACFAEVHGVFDFEHVAGLPALQRVLRGLPGLAELRALRAPAGGPAGRPASARRSGQKSGYKSALESARFAHDKHYAVLLSQLGFALHKLPAADQLVAAHSMLAAAAGQSQQCLASACVLLSHPVFGIADPVRPAVHEAAFQALRTLPPGRLQQDGCDLMLTMTRHENASPKLTMQKLLSVWQAFPDMGQGTKPLLRRSVSTPSIARDLRDLRGVVIP